MASHKTKRSGRSSIGAFVVLGTVVVGCLGLAEVGCGGSEAAVSIGDAGPDGTAASEASTGNKDSSTGKADSGKSDSGKGDATKPPQDSGSGADQASPPVDSGMDSPVAMDGGSGSGSSIGSGSGSTVGSGSGSSVGSGSGSGSGSGVGSGSGSSAGSGSGSSSGSGSGTNSCTDDAQCVGNSNGALCLAGHCAKCTTDAQCQSDANFGVTTICATTGASTGNCISSTCTAAGACAANPADFCCSANGTADYSAAGTDVCVPGACCTNSDCTTATAAFCVANKCGPCTSDSQCAANHFCATSGASAGECVASACATTTGGGSTATPGANGGAPPGTCTAAPTTDMCCTISGAAECILSPTGGGITTCCPGSTGNANCQTALADSHAVCSNNVCTSCAALSGNTYIVDPINGSDTSGTGNPQTGGGAAAPACALRTITRALQLIGPTAPTLATTIEIIGGGATTATVSAGETFPLIIPSNVTITTKANSGAVSVTVPNGRNGFTFAGNGTAAQTNTIEGTTGSSLTITSANNGGNDGIVTGPASTAIVNITKLSVTGMANDGIRVLGGTTTIGAGVASNNNGPAAGGGAGTGNGLNVTGGEAVINVTGAGVAGTTFNGNGQHGIIVTQGGYVNITGTVASATAGTGTITTNANYYAGVWLQQTPPGGTGTVPTNTISGLVSFGNTNGHGMRIITGSSVTVRSSAFLNNTGDGVLISAVPGAIGTNNSVAGIDLGSGNASGLNTFQAVTAGPHNGAAGICIALANVTPANTLLAQGNQFQEATSCTATTGAPTLLENPNGCANNPGQCAGGICDLGLQNTGGGGASTNTFDVTHCTP